MAIDSTQLTESRRAGTIQNGVELVKLRAGLPAHLITCPAKLHVCLSSCPANLSTPLSVRLCARQSMCCQIPQRLSGRLLVQLPARLFGRPAMVNIPLSAHICTVIYLICHGICVSSSAVCPPPCKGTFARKCTLAKLSCYGTYTCNADLSVRLSRSTLADS